MSLGSLVSIKNTNPGYLPLLLCAFTFTGQSTPGLLVSTHPFNTAEGGSSFPGIGILPAGDYFARIMQQDIGAFQERSSLGIDRIAEITIHLADADHFIWSNFATVYGFRGASVQMALVMWDASTQQFSTDAAVMFTGTCDQESWQSGGNLIAVHANNGHNTATIKLPDFPIQNRCPLDFPATLAQRIAAATDPSSIYYGCGYSKGVSGGVGNSGPANHFDGFGNQVTDSSGIFIACDFVRSNSADATSGCMARLGNAANTSVAPDGDLMHDQSGHHTGNFAGVEWSPGTYYAIDKNYVSSSQIATFSFQNAAILGQYQNILYGTQWVQAKIANVIEDGNYTRCEAMVCEGDVGPFGIQTVTSNGVELTMNSGMNDVRWNFVNTGSRNGSMCTDAGYNSPGHSALGDPYGSVCTIECVFDKDIFTGFGTPQVNVLASGPKLNVFTSPTTSALQGAPANSNPAWVLLDILTRANWTYAEINIASFIAAASFCDTSIPYINQTGATTSHAIYQCMFTLQQRKTAAEVISGVLRSFNGYLYWDQTGLLNLGINGTLADSQPSVIAGSNYNTAVPSIHFDNSTGNGFVAYSFDESDVLRKADGTPDLDMVAAATVQTPNQIYISFQDQDNQFQTDSLGEIDPDAVTRAGGSLQPGGSVVPDTPSIIGICNFDQATRIANTYMAELQRGNEGDDPRGTRTFTFSTDVRCEHLRVGHLVFFTWQSLAISQQLFRVQSVQTQTDGQPWKITLTWVNEVWYTYEYGQAPQAFYGESNRSRPQRAPFPWQADLETPNSSMFSDTEKTFGLAEIDTFTPDGAAIISMKVTGTYPVNQVLTQFGPPLVPVQGTSSSTGGSIPGGGNLYVQLCALDSSGNYTAPSKTIVVAVPSGTITNTITLSPLYWQTGTVGYDVFVGTTTTSFTHQLRNNSSVPTSITLTSLPNTLAYAPPDLSVGSLYVQAKQVIHAGCIGTQVAALTSSTVTLSPAAGGAFATANIVSGAITSYTMVAGGFGYTTIGGDTATVTITGDGSGATATPVVTDGQVTGITVGSGGSGYTTATVTINSQPLNNNLAGTYLQLIGRPSLTGTGTNFPIIDFQIVSNSGYVCTVDRDPSSLLQVDDAIVVTLQPTSVTAGSITFGNFISAYFGDVGTQDLTGYMLRCIAGTGRYQIRTIASTSLGTTYTITQPWTVMPDTTSVFIVEEPSWTYHSNTIQINSEPFYNQIAQANVNIGNFGQQAVLVQCLLGDPTDTLWSSQYRSPFRVIWLFGNGGLSERIVTASTTQTQTDGSLECDTTAGSFIVNLLPSSQVSGRKLIIEKVSADTNTVTIQPYSGETIKGQPFLLLSDQWDAAEISSNG